MRPRQLVLQALAIVALFRCGPVLAASLCPMGESDQIYWPLLAETVEREDAAPPTSQLTARINTEIMTSRPSVQMVLERGGNGIIKADAWASASYLAAAISEERIVRKRQQRDASGNVIKDSLGQTVVPPADYARAGLERPLLVKRDADSATLSVALPDTRYGRYGEKWRIVIAACDSENHALLGYGLILVTPSPFALSVLLTVVGVLGLWAFLALAAWREHARRLQKCYAAVYCAEHPDVTVEQVWNRQVNWRNRWAWKLARVIHPVFVTQDAFGVGSLSRFQLFASSLVVAGIVSYILLRSGTLPNLSSDILLLLGITSVSTTLARAAQAVPSIAPRNRMWLLGNGVVTADDRLPRGRDWVVSDGEVDVTRVQSLAFTALTLCALVSYGVTDLQHFAIPQAINYLLGLSQGVYVVGKLIPSDRVTQLNDSIARVIDAEQKWQTSKNDQTLKDLCTAWKAATPGLRDVFEARFREDAYKPVPDFPTMC